MRSSGRVSRSSPYMIFDRKYPLTQLTPRFTSACGSPCVATTWPSLTATLTPQPTPQKRHGAFDHLSCDCLASVTMFWACAVTSALPVPAAAEAAARKMNCRRVISSLMDLAVLQACGGRPDFVLISAL